MRIIHRRGRGGHRVSGYFPETGLLDGWWENLFSFVSFVPFVVVLLFFFSSCHYTRPNLSSEGMSQKTDRKSVV